MIYKNEKGEVKVDKIIAHIIIVVIAIILILSNFGTVKAGERGVLLQFGAVQDKIFGEGLYFTIPFVQSVKKLDIKIQKEETEVPSASKDLQTVSSKIALNYHLESDKVTILWQSVGKDYKERLIDPAIQEAFKASTAKYTAEELITKRSEVKETAKVLLTERLLKDYIVVDELSIVDFDFSPSFNQAIEAKVTAEQNALAAKNKLEQVKFEAEQRISQAKGEAEAIQIQAEAITQQGGKDYLTLKWIEAWSKGGSQVPNTILGDGGSNFIFDLNK